MTEPDDPQPDMFPKAVVVLLIVIAVLVLLVLLELKDLNTAVGA